LNPRLSEETLVREPADRWTVADASELYDVARWGKSYFSVSERGHLLVHPTKEPERSIDLKELVDNLVLRGISLPILIRFAEILKHSLKEIHEAFQNAIAEHGYQGGYCCAYPIKVNQQRQVVAEVFQFGRPYRFGLEAGSKPELLAVLAIADNETPILCNGFKDAEYIEMVKLAKKIGRQIIPVVEKFTELHMILEHARRVGVRPALGVRLKLASRGSGRWRSSGGYRSKFGLTAIEALRALEQLKALGMEDCLELLHFHLGSQITNIRQIKGAVTEAARMYVELRRAGAGLRYLDVGGGLGVDYDGSQTDFESSVNYSLQEYATDLVYHVQSVCDEAEVPHPTIVSESGRAVAAYHSVLVFNVLGVSGFGEEEAARNCRTTASSRCGPAGNLPLAEFQKPARGVSRCAAGAGFGAESFQPGLPAAGAALPGRKPLLGDLPPGAETGQGGGRLPRGTGAARRPAFGYLLLQFFGIPKPSRQLGRQAVVPHHAHSPVGRAAHPARRDRRRQL
jgi:arginine decarboxylase